MKTYLECLPCYLNQALRAAKMAGADPEVSHKIMSDTAAFIPQLNMELSPAENGTKVYHIVFDETGVSDPYYAIKRQHIDDALAILPELEAMVEDSDDPLLTAIRIAVAGNIIDLGIPDKINLVEDVRKILKQDFALFDYEQFREKLDKASSVLYLGDNAGESVFDTILIKALKKPVVYAVREHPIINDVTYSEAVLSGLDKVAEIVSSGTSAPGTILHLCSNEFIDRFNKADMIISKGQGNYEGLSDETNPIFFLLKAKCGPIANDLGVHPGDIVLKSLI
jgi:uncharacterized protein with ATP-grasp and redox domains